MGWAPCSIPWLVQSATAALFNQFRFEIMLEPSILDPLLLLCGHSQVHLCCVDENAITVELLSSPLCGVPKLPRAAIVRGSLFTLLS